MGRLTGKVALVTAAGQGIGRATAKAFILEGAEVVATDRDTDLLGGLDCRTEGLDVTDKAAVTGLIGGLPRLDVLFNCYVDGNGDSAIEMRDFACEKKCVDGGEGQYDYCSDSPAPIIT